MIGNSFLKIWLNWKIMCPAFKEGPRDSPRPMAKTWQKMKVQSTLQAFSFRSMLNGWGIHCDVVNPHELNLHILVFQALTLGNPFESQIAEIGILSRYIR
ncbi:MAG: hypothetical protein MUO26_14610 [Methanotrichaceae archaeon]|nr:hypothetical protein [Methanotrichaceae archaeon]